MAEEKRAQAEKLAAFIEKAVTPFHTVAESRKLLEAAGFKALKMTDEWKLEVGGRYYVTPDSKELIAFRAGTGSRLHVAAAHTDFPCLHVKPMAESERGGYLRVNTEVYGSPILNTWLDRPLSLAGRVFLKSDDIYAPREVLVDMARPLLTIPNLAIHYNRDVNKGVELTKQNDMLPLLGMINDELNRDSYFIDLVAAEMAVDKNDILDFDLFVYNCEKPVFTGMNGELLSAPRIDNITSCFALVEGLIEAGTSGADGTDVIALFDNEEVGSRSKMGADSMMLRSILSAVYAGLGRDDAALCRDIAGGMLLSVDVAHAVHPAHGEKYDPVNNMRINDGVTFKLSVNQRYSYDSEAVAILMQLCGAEGIAFRKFVNNSDMPGGGTLGPIISAWLPMKTVDIGVPILAMHSARELMGAYDQGELEKLIRAFFG